MDLKIVKENKTVVVFTRLTDKQNDQIEILAKKNKVEKAAVIRRLIEIGLESANV